MKRLYLFAFAVFLWWSSFAFADDAKMPVPTAPAQQKALSLIREVYGPEWDAAKTNEQKQALAKKLLTKAGESQDLTNKYVLLRVARDIATSGGDGLTAYWAIDEMARLFQVDAVIMKADVLYAGAKKARLPADHRGSTFRSYPRPQFCFQPQSDADLSSSFFWHQGYLGRKRVIPSFKEHHSRCCSLAGPSLRKLAESSGV